MPWTSNWVIYHVLWVIKPDYFKTTKTKPAFNCPRGTCFLYFLCLTILVMALIFLFYYFDFNILFKIVVNIRAAMCWHFSELFIVAIRLHFQLGSECLVHLQTIWAASLHYTVALAFILGFYLSLLAVVKPPFVTVMRLAWHTKGQLWDLNAQKNGQSTVLFSFCVSSITPTCLIHYRVSKSNQTFCLLNQDIQGHCSDC